MSWVLVNRISVDSPDQADRLVEAFRHRSGQVDQQPGFAGIEVWREEKGTEVMVSTRWGRKEDFEAWVSSAAFRRAHGQAEGGPGRAAGMAYEVVL